MASCEFFLHFLSLVVLLSVSLYPICSVLPARALDNVSVNTLLIQLESLRSVVHNPAPLVQIYCLLMKSEEDSARQPSVNEQHLLLWEHVLLPT